MQDNKGRTALLDLIENLDSYNRDDIIKTIIEKEADLIQPDGKTPLMCLVQSNFSYFFEKE